MLHTLALLILATAQDSPRRPIPDEADRKSALKLVQELFDREYRERTLPARRALMTKLWEEAGRNKDDAPSCYVLLRESLSIATELGDAQAAGRAIDDLSRLFEVDGLALTSTTLAALAKAARTPEENLTCAQQYLALADRAILESNFDAAEKAAASGAALARSAKNLPLISRADGKLKEVSTLRTQAKAAQTARETLAKAPEDPDANGALGSYLCLVQERWEQGLPHLAKGPPGALRTAALLDLSAPQESAKWVAAGDAWWDAGQKETGKVAEACRRRASPWYLKAFPELSGLTRARIEKRLGDALKDAGPVRTLVVEALIDGNTELHVTPMSIYWKNIDVSKVGKHQGRNEPTYVNGAKWMPTWKYPNEERGADQTDPYPIVVGPVENLAFELTAVGTTKGATGIQPRDRIVPRVENGEFILLIPDHQADSRWYTLTIRPK